MTATPWKAPRARTQRPRPSSGDLKFNTRYNFTYSVVDGAGRQTHSTRAFTTVSTANEADAAIYPLDGMKVGVAQPLQITFFSEPVLNRNAVEKAIKITSTSGQRGDFHRFNNNTVRYRPQNFRPPTAPSPWTCSCSASSWAKGRSAISTRR